ncbi:MAG: stage IV sporulation protein A [Lachnospiraceae bacterium]
MDHSMEFDLYQDIKARTNGEIYIGVVGPVRSGKSTFIKKFMDLIVIPNIKEPADRLRATDELPQSSAGKTIMTTEPKFVPKEAVQIQVEGIPLKVRLIDCVGFMVQGAAGHTENNEERLVKTPWDQEPIPFTRAAEIGTRKVIHDHSTVGIVITGDGSFGDFERKDYFDAEEKTITELKKLGKPFVVLLNSSQPSSEKTRSEASQLAQKHGCLVIPMDCQNLNYNDINQIFSELLNTFPVSEIQFELPKWAQMLPEDSGIREELITFCRNILQDVSSIKSARNISFDEIPDCIEAVALSAIQSSDGCVRIDIKIDNRHYFNMLSDMCGETIENEYQLVSLIQELTQKKTEFEKVGDAVSQVHINGYSVVMPTREQIQLASPEVIKNGNKFGVKIRADATTIYMLETSIHTEIAPIVGSEQQANDLIQYIGNNAAGDPEGLWETNIFGKTIEQIVADGMNDKIHNMTEDNMNKLRDTLQKVMNENSGLVCLIV